jgi:hypothetical protein
MKSVTAATAPVAAGAGLKPAPAAGWILSDRFVMQDHGLWRSWVEVLHIFNFLSAGNSL